MSKIYLSSKGIKPTIDNSTIINKAIVSSKNGDTLIFPSGKFPIHSPIVIENKNLFIETSDRNTEILVSLNTPALIITGNIDKKTYIKDLKFINYGDGSNDGVIVSSVVVFENLEISVFKTGLTVSADISNDTQASGSIFRNILIANCTKDGIYTQGGDANKCSFYDIDVRDCKENGINECSFLGNYYSGCMAHNNGRNYRSYGGNNYSTFTGCYSEQGSLPEYLSGAQTWFGGLPGNGFELHGYAKVYGCRETPID